MDRPKVDQAVSVEWRVEEYSGTLDLHATPGSIHLGVPCHMSRKNASFWVSDEKTAMPRLSLFFL